MYGDGILYTRNDGGIDICYPTRNIFCVMQAGGYWDDRPRGFLEAQIERQVKAGISREHATRFALAVAFGGVSEPEAWMIIRDRDCARHGSDFQLIHTSELPDRWFRDAWTRKGSNSGLPYVDLKLAKPIQWTKIVRAVEAENKKRALDLYGKKPIKLNKLTWQRAIANARDADELRRVMPDLR
jgi:hypothetical protein